MLWHCIRGLAASAGVQLIAIETEISATFWTFEPRGELYFVYNHFTKLFCKKHVFDWLSVKFIFRS